MTSTAEANSWPRALRRRPWHLVVAPRSHYRRATVVSPQDRPRLPRAARRRTCTDAREESVLWIGPVPSAHTLNAYYFAADEVCLAPSLDVPGYRQVEQSDKGARNGAIGKAVRLGGCRCG